jgi:hypothetical protein
VCVRYAPQAGGELPEAEAARIHRVAAREIERQGRFWFSTTELKGRSYFRICPVNFRTRLEHMDELFDTLRRECARAAGRS